MRKTITLVLIFITIPIYSQWMRQNSGVTANLNDVYCIGANVVIAVGDAGTILKTVDGGAHWNHQNPTAASLSKVQFVNANVGYIVGVNGTVLKTTDAGENWSAINIGTTANLYGLSCLSENVFFISGDNGLLKKTVNGGNSFETINTTAAETVKDIQFFSESTGYLEAGEALGSGQGDTLFKTTDGGNTWKTVKDYMNAFFFVDENIGFINTLGEGLQKTTDSGLSLSYLGGYISTEADLFALDANQIWEARYSLTLCDCNEYCIVKGSIAISGEYGDIANCNTESINETYLQAIYFANETTGYAVGWGGTILKNATGTMLQVDNADRKTLVGVYPNPVKEMLNLNLPANAVIKSFQIYDLTGKNITAIQRTNNQIDVNSLAKGLYVLEITTADESNTVKFVKE